ncbi:ATP-binding protein [Herpetosiphon sp. NSE202]|uniref:ATP-binding protein n=1 Tax=Herpetosiphon sp. NSE202 TaxID=3351349 RepID=UPI0036448B1A
MPHPWPNKMLRQLLRGEILSQSLQQWVDNHGGRQVVVQTLRDGMSHDVDALAFFEQQVNRYTTESQKAANLNMADSTYYAKRGRFYEQLRHLLDHLPSLRPTTIIGLPIPLTPLVGRQAVLQELLELCRDYRLVTLHGIGGIGKTRLAIALASYIANAGFAQEVVFVDLRNEYTVHDSWQALLNRWLGDPKADLTSYIQQSNRRTVLIIDNCEHIRSIAEMLLPLLNFGNVSIITTTQIALSINGERRFPVPALSLEEGILLFEQRARDLNRQVERRQTEQIVQRLAGHPLAIEIAASQLLLVSASDILAMTNVEMLEIESLANGSAPHRTLRQMVEYSFSLLSDDVQAACLRLALFEHHFSLAQATKAFKVNWRVASSLVDASCLEGSVDSRGETRFSMPLVTRLYARQVALERDVYHQLMLEFSQYWASEIKQILQQWEQTIERAKDHGELLTPMNDLSLLRDSYTTIRGCLQWASIYAQDQLLELIAGLWKFWLHYESPEGKLWLRSAMSMINEQQRAELQPILLLFS